MGFSLHFQYFFAWLGAVLCTKSYTNVSQKFLYFSKLRAVRSILWYKWISIRVLHICCLIWVKFNISANYSLQRLWVPWKSFLVMLFVWAYIEFYLHLRPENLRIRKQWTPWQSVYNTSRSTQFTIVLSMFAKFRKETVRFFVSSSVHPHVTNRLSLEVFSCNSIFKYFFRKYAKKVRVLLKYRKHKKYFSWRRR